MVKSSLKENKNFILVLTLVVINILIIGVFSFNNSSFIADDFDHFSDISVVPFPDLLFIPIDVHFAPMHKLLSYLLFSISGLNFGAAIFVMSTLWFLTWLLLYKTLNLLTTKNNSLIISALFISSPVFLHIIIWWSAAAHRLPFLALQAASIYSYITFRKKQNHLYGSLLILMQIISIGFYIKSIFFAAIIASIEICMAIRERKISYKNIILIALLGSISLIYIIWYLKYSNAMRFNNDLNILNIIHGSIIYLSRFSSSILLLPIDNYYSSSISFVFFASLISWSIWRSPKTSIPIFLLLSLLLLDFTLALIGRGSLIIFPYAAARYYVDEIVVTAIFVGIIVSYHKKPAFIKKYSFKIFYVVFIIYILGSILASQNFFSKAYENYIKIHRYVNNVNYELNKISSRKENTEILESYFPKYIYSFTSPKRLSAVWSKDYPKLKWVSSIKANKNYIYFNEDGNLEDLKIPSDPNFTDTISFPDWSTAETEYRWSSGHSAKILFSTELDYLYEGKIIFHGHSLGQQRLNISINGEHIDQILMHPHSRLWEINFNPAYLNKGNINQIDIALPDAHQPDNGDTRVLAIAIKRLEIK